MTKTDHSHYTESWLRHVRCLAVEIGPRGSTTDGERRGAEYCQSTLNQMGLTGRMEAFTSDLMIVAARLDLAGSGCAGGWTQTLVHRGLGVTLVGQYVEIDIVGADIQHRLRDVLS